MESFSSIASSTLARGKRAIKLWGWRSVLEIAETGATEIFLACSIGKSYGFNGQQGRGGTLSVKNPNLDVIWIRFTEIDALFQLL